MKAFIITATKGRTKETQRLLDCLQRQIFQLTFTIIAGTEPRHFSSKVAPNIAFERGVPKAARPAT